MTRRPALAGLHQDPRRIRAWVHAGPAGVFSCHRIAVGCRDEAGSVACCSRRPRPVGRGGSSSHFESAARALPFHGHLEICRSRLPNLLHGPERWWNGRAPTCCQGIAEETQVRRIPVRMIAMLPGAFPGTNKKWQAGSPCPFEVAVAATGATIAMNRLTWNPGPGAVGPSEWCQARHPNHGLPSAPTTHPLNSNLAFRVTSTLDDDRNPRPISISVKA